jgi:FSR family fosmidomycin resistance protein-like MFS transporter
MHPVSNNKLLSIYSTSHYLLHSPANVFTALVFLILQYFELELIEFGLILTVVSFVSGLCSPLGGVLADRFGHRIWPPLSMTITGSATLIVGVFGKTSIYLVIACLLTISFASALFHPSCMTTVSTRFNHSSSKAFSLFALGGQAGYGTGPLTVAILLWLGGGILKDPFLAYKLWSFPVLCMSVVLTYIHVKDPTLGVITTLNSPPEEISTAPLPTSTVKALFFPAFLLLLLAMSVQSIGRSVYDPYLVLFLVDRRQILQATAVFYYSMLIIVGLPGTILGGYWGDKYGEKPILISAYALAMFGILLLLVLPNPVWLPFIFLLLALGQNATMPTTDSLTGKIVPLNVRGKAYGLSFLFPVVLGSLAPVTGALILQIFDYEAIFLLVIVLYALAALMTFFIRDKSPMETIPISASAK